MGVWMRRSVGNTCRWRTRTTGRSAWLARWAAAGERRRCADPDLRHRDQFLRTSTPTPSPSSVASSSATTRGTAAPAAPAAPATTTAVVTAPSTRPTVPASTLAASMRRFELLVYIGRVRAARSATAGFSHMRHAPGVTFRRSVWLVVTDHVQPPAVRSGRHAARRMLLLQRPFPIQLRRPPERPLPSRAATAIGAAVFSAASIQPTPYTQPTSHSVRF